MGVARGWEPAGSGELSAREHSCSHTAGLSSEEHSDHTRDVSCAREQRRAGLECYHHRMRKSMSIHE